MKTRAFAPVVLVTALLALSACSSNSQSEPVKAIAVAAPTAVAAATSTAQVSKLVANNSRGLGEIVTDQNGFTLYRFEKDSIAPPTSNCADQCATTWPPAIIGSTSLGLSGIDNAAVGTITRADGSKQLTIGGHPLYHYKDDTAPGQTNGQGVGQTWFALTPNGNQAQAGTTGATLSAAQSPQLGTIVTDADGFTLYRFDKDTAKPSRSNCTGACALTWPPAVVTAKNPTVNGIDPAVVSTITRADGSRQLTIGGWPVYEFSKDTAQGDVKGQGVGGIWFAVTPTGQKASGTVAGTPAAPAAGTPAAGTSASGY